MTKLKVRGLKWKKLKGRGSVLHFCQNIKLKKKKKSNKLSVCLYSTYSRPRFLLCIFVLFFFFFFFNFHAFLEYCGYCSLNSNRKCGLSVVNSAHVHCSRTHKFHFLSIFSLKMGPTALFTHLKIILLQCFQFSVFSFSKISSIQTHPKESHP